MSSFNKIVTIVLIVAHSKSTNCSNSTNGTNIKNSNRNYRFSLEKGSKKFYCPECGERKFVRFIDHKTGEYLPEKYGRCDKGDGHYFLDPRKDGYTKMIWEQENRMDGKSNIKNDLKPNNSFSITKKPSEIVPFDKEEFDETLISKNYNRNVFIQNLYKNIPFPFEKEDLRKVINLYSLGTVFLNSSGCITFPFINLFGEIRAVQIKQFNAENKTVYTSYLHAIIKRNHIQLKKEIPKWLEKYDKQENKISCLFGEHLLKLFPNNPVALVEAPKTAVYGTLYFGFPEKPDDLIWLAVGAKGYLKFDKIKVLEGRRVIVFPDLSKEGTTFKEWKQKIKDYEKKLPNTSFIFSDLLEKFASNDEKNEGLDIGDYLIKFDWRIFRYKK